MELSDLFFVMDIAVCFLLGRKAVSMYSLDERQY
jgi:hypothetical protein